MTDKGEFIGRKQALEEVEKVIEPVNYRIKEIIENYESFNEVPLHITFLVKEWEELKSKLKEMKK